MSEEALKSRPCVPKRVVRGKQRNHGDFYLPDSIRHLAKVPLYRAVAWWGMLRGGYITRDDVSQAFRIELRRAGGILNYIRHRGREGDIQVEVRHQTSRQARSTQALRIVSMASTLPVERNVKVSSGSSRVTVNQDRMMARWLLSRPVGNNAVRFALWKAACPIAPLE